MVALSRASDVADAAMRGDKAAVRALIPQKADVNAPQARWRHGAALGRVPGDRELADMLIRAGANAKAANREGSTPLWLGERQR